MMPGTFMSELQFGIRMAIPGDGPVAGPLATELGYTNNRAETADQLGRVLAGEP